MEKRPINLNLLTMHWPIPSIVSFLHRLSGVVLFFLIPFMLWVLQESLASESQFGAMKERFSIPWVQFIFWSLIAALLYHLIAGLRHLLMDVHVGDSKRGGEISAYFVLCLFILCWLVTGYWIWMVSNSGI